MPLSTSTTTTTITRYECDDCLVVESLINEAETKIGWDVYQERVWCKTCAAYRMRKHFVGRVYAYRDNPGITIFFKSGDIKNADTAQVTLEYGIEKTEPNKYNGDKPMVYALNCTMAEFARMYGPLNNYWERVLTDDEMEEAKNNE